MKKFPTIHEFIKWLQALTTELPDGDNHGCATCPIALFARDIGYAKNPWVTHDGYIKPNSCSDERVRLPQWARTFIRQYDALHNKNKAQALSIALDIQSREL